MSSDSLRQHFGRLERRNDARLGVLALDTGSRKTAATARITTTGARRRGPVYVITYIRMSAVSPYRDGRTYDQISAPLERIGREVLDRLDLRGDETVLDAGCGSGRVTEALVERLPRGRVIGVDGSPEMIAAARRRLGEDPDLLVQDLALLDLGDTTVDAVLSTATFHWIPDHRALFGRLRTVLAPGGRLVAQLGGTGNTAELLDAIAAVTAQAPFAQDLGGWPGPWNFPAPDETAALLGQAGFGDVEAWLIHRPAPYDELVPWLRVNALTAHTQRLPLSLREPFITAVAQELGHDPKISYVRLNIDATAI